MSNNVVKVKEKNVSTRNSPGSHLRFYSTHPVKGERGVRRFVKSLWPLHHMDVWCILSFQKPDISWCSDAKTHISTTFGTFYEKEMKPYFPWDLLLFLLDFWKMGKKSFYFKNIFIQLISHLYKGSIIPSDSYSNMLMHFWTSNKKLIRSALISELIMFLLSSNLILISWMAETTFPLKSDALYLEAFNISF